MDLKTQQALIDQIQRNAAILNKEGHDFADTFANTRKANRRIAELSMASKPRAFQDMNAGIYEHPVLVKLVREHEVRHG